MRTIVVHDEIDVSTKFNVRIRKQRTESRLAANSGYFVVARTSSETIREIVLLHGTYENERINIQIRYNVVCDDERDSLQTRA